MENLIFDEAAERVLEKIMEYQEKGYEVKKDVPFNPLAMLLGNSKEISFDSIKEEVAEEMKAEEKAGKIEKIKKEIERIDSEIKKVSEKVYKTNSRKIVVGGKDEFDDESSFRIDTINEKKRNRMIRNLLSEKEDCKFELKKLIL